MTIESVQYSLQGQIATIRIDDGKRNALSPQVLRELYRAFDRAEFASGVDILIVHVAEDLMCIPVEAR